MLGVVATSSPVVEPSELVRATEAWRRLGFDVVVAEHARAVDDYVAGPAADRADDLHAMFGDDSIDAVFSLRGGFGCAELLPLIDVDLLAGHPKPFIGFSDASFIHLLLNAHDVPSVYGPGFLAMGQAATSAFERDRLVAVLRGAATGPVPAHPDEPYVTRIAPGRAQGTLVGGCLAHVRQTVGTPWQIDCRDRLLFLEDVDQLPHRIEASLLHLEHAGVFHGVRGIVLGEMAGCEWDDAPPFAPRMRTLEGALRARLSQLGVPVIYGLPLGHGRHLAALPLGCEAELDADAGTLTITSSPFALSGV